MTNKGSAGYNIKVKRGSKRHSGGCARIKGSTKCFLDTPQFASILCDLKQGMFLPRCVIEFRNVSKELMADRLRKTAISCNQYEAFSREAMRVFVDALRDQGYCEKVRHNVHCILRYWSNGTNAHVSNCRVRAKNRRDQQDAWKRARLDIEELKEKIIIPVFDLIETRAVSETGSLYRNTLDTIGSVDSICKAVEIVLELFDFIYSSSLPPKLEKTCMAALPEGGDHLLPFYSSNDTGFQLKTAEGKSEKHPYMAGADTALSLYIQLFLKE